MDSEYTQFQPPATSPFRLLPTVNLRTGARRAADYAPWGALLLLLLVLLLLTGIKFAQLHREVQDVRVHLGRLADQWDSDGGLRDYDIWHSHVSMEEIVPVQGRCKEDWMSFQSSCYHISVHMDNWTEAERQCASYGGHLLVLNTVEELDYISKVVNIRRNYWIGLVERSHEGQWSWLDGTDIGSTPLVWDEGQPDNWEPGQGGEDCGQIHNSAKRIRKLLNDASCDRHFGYICEARV